MQFLPEIMAWQRFAESVFKKREKNEFENFDICMSESAIATTFIFVPRLTRQISYIVVLIIEFEHVTSFRAANQQLLAKRTMLSIDLAKPL